MRKRDNVFEEFPPRNVHFRTVLQVTTIFVREENWHTAKSTRSAFPTTLQDIP